MSGIFRDKVREIASMPVADLPDTEFRRVLREPANELQQRRILETLKRIEDLIQSFLGDKS